MIAVVTVLLCVPLGWFVRSRLVANTTYAVAYLWAFVFQTLYLHLGSAFRSGDFPLSYGLVTASVFAVGFGLIAVTHHLRSRRSSRQGSAPPHEALSHSA
jgi:uncharacterized membrane protein